MCAVPKNAIVKNKYEIQGGGLVMVGWWQNF